jgi:hypothetical protein
MQSSKIREFETGANRDSDDGKYDFEAFLSPEVLFEFAEYMHGKRHLIDGTYRDGDNWQKGMPINVHVKSFIRHSWDLWLWSRSREIRPKQRIARLRPRPEDGKIPPIKDTLAALLFAIQGIWLEIIKEEDAPKPGSSKPEPNRDDGGYIGFSDLAKPRSPSTWLRYRN